MKFNYEEICQNLLSSLPSRTKDVLERRFALSSQEEKETLESIGKDYDICRERVRQIENKGISKLRKNVDRYTEVFDYFRKYLKEQGGIKREDLLLEDISEKNQSQVFFLLTLEDNFIRERESEEMHALWTLDEKNIEKAKDFINFINEKLEEKGDLIKLDQIEIPEEFKKLKEKILYSFIEVSKEIGKNSENEIGSTNWPEINPKRVKDKAFLVLKDKGEPLHFKDVATQIGSDALPQTVHNELIRDERFVLVGRGLYALKEWGYKEGTVKEVIRQIIEENDTLLNKKELIKKVLDQRFVKRNTVLLNLNSGPFDKQKGGYTVKES